MRAFFLVANGVMLKKFCFRFIKNSCHTHVMETDIIEKQVNLKRDLNLSGKLSFNWIVEKGKIFLYSPPKNSKQKINSTLIRINESQPPESCVFD